MESLSSFPSNFRRASSVLQHEIEKSIVVIIPPGRDLVRRGCQIILERHTLGGCPVSKCSVAIVMVEKIGIADPERRCARPGDKETKKPVVIVIAPDCGPGICIIGQPGRLRHISECAVAVIAIEGVPQVSLSRR